MSLTAFHTVIRTSCLKVHLIAPFSWWTTFKDSQSPTDWLQPWFLFAAPLHAGTLASLSSPSPTIPCVPGGSWEALHKGYNFTGLHLCPERLPPPSSTLFSRGCFLRIFFPNTFPTPWRNNTHPLCSQSAPCPWDEKPLWARTVLSRSPLCFQPPAHAWHIRGVQGTNAGLKGDLGDLNDLRAAVKFLHHFKHLSEPV